MLSALVQEGAEAYLAILEALQGRPDASNTLATDQDLPKLAGTVLDSAAAVEQALSAQAVAAAPWWLPVQGATWLRPEGPCSDVRRDGRRAAPSPPPS